MCIHLYTRVKLEDQYHAFQSDVSYFLRCGDAGRHDELPFLNGVCLDPSPCLLL